ncbi:hypothetical protein BST81_18540 [Leptolyngbya sp. 'hensonii']|uniref:hypothetical protein n=1 Tax=Leptolyngbya sp. 'hensonii' TaxID=1922337 RepID=UPI00094F99AD|nr:hypothetical protein [Leptolyngbya sp. 'hensonii']OLP16981.1 hypothetical protein BST81_18540 [Leptolyngbya sp. 'hensonii']
MVEQLRNALLEVLEDQYRAQVTYRLILDKFGLIRLFANIAYLLSTGLEHGFAECKYELPSSPTLLPQEKGAKTLVPSPLGEGCIRLKHENHPSIQQRLEHNQRFFCS